ncbi:hypothetical protein CFOL_v3_33773 [Cephalotus follicularis]|uniref:Uncharacterized protein n=1 Tax=Cephalotus follicularis TaxID=3775 RepID=A0A1Q3DD07_CEPFO|nr:hypothetical protein CFOL_v3_33773 [Cephalotus follicularis]
MASISTNSNPSTYSPRTQTLHTTRAIFTLPWTQIVRGESEPIAAAPSSPKSFAIEQDDMAANPASAAAATPPVAEECTENGGPNGNAGKRPAWNKPSNGAAEVGPVNGAHSWPALSDAARACSYKSSSDYLKGLFDGSSSVSGSQVQWCC